MEQIEFVVDTLTNERHTVESANRLPRIAGKTQFTRKTSSDGWRAWKFEPEEQTQSPGPDYVKAPASKDTDGIYRLKWVQRTQTPEALLEQAKQERRDRVASIIVTTAAGNTFDGNEDSQNRMTRALLGLQDGETIEWVLANNSSKFVNKAELAEALRLAGQEQARLWVEPYKD